MKPRYSSRVKAETARSRLARRRCVGFSMSRAGFVGRRWTVRARSRIPNSTVITLILVRFARAGPTLGTYSEHVRRSSYKEGKKTRPRRRFFMPEEGLEPPTRGL
jgi:hypothetical protein